MPRVLPASLTIALATALTSVVTATVALAVAVVSLPAAAEADVPPVDTVAEVRLTLPAVPASADHTDVRVDLRTVPSAPAVAVRLDCDGYGPTLFQRIAASPPGVVSYVFRNAAQFPGVTCTVSGSSTIPSQTVEFTPAPVTWNDGGVLVTTLNGLVIIHSPTGGLG